MISGQRPLDAKVWELPADDARAFQHLVAALGELGGAPIDEKVASAGRRQLAAVAS